MQQDIRKLKRKWLKSWNQFLDRVTFTLKIILSLIVLFFAILFFIIKPAESLEHKSSSHQDEVLMRDNLNKEEFIEVVTPHALAAKDTHGIRPSILIAQAALESNWGKSTLSTESNNFFGIKGSNTDGQYATKEFTNNEWTQINASFRRYNSLGESVRDYANLMRNGTSWDSNFYKKVLDATNYKDAATALQEAGYATDPDYADKLIRIIGQYQLYELDV